MEQNTHPRTLLEAIRYFSDIDRATEFVAKLRWPDGFVCPACGGREYSYLTTRRLWKCKACKKQTSVKKGTVFEDSPLGLDKWLPAMWLLCNCKNGISSHELARDLGVHQQSAWFMLHRIRLAMRTGTFNKLSGVVEADESYVGGKGQNMHASKRKEKIHGAGIVDKTAVMGVMERGGEVVAKVIPDNKKATLHGMIRRHVAAGSTVYSDKLPSYRGLDADFEHYVVDHYEAYVRGQIHTNSIENFWSLLKRSLHGTYVSVRPEHLDAYVAEQVCRFNARHGQDSDRLTEVLRRVSGRRITYRELTSKR